MVLLSSFRKICRAVCRIHLGLQDSLELGNYDSGRDWGHAREYVRCMWNILQLEKPGDYVIATGELRCMERTETLSIILYCSVAVKS